MSLVESARRQLPTSPNVCEGWKMIRTTTPAMAGRRAANAGRERQPVDPVGRRSLTEDGCRRQDEHRTLSPRSGHDTIRGR
jgi:hypothetical protein